jgi:hypothetical protein
MGPFGIAVARIVTAMLILTFAVQIGSAMVHSKLSIPFDLGCVGWYLLLSVRLKENPKRTLCHGVLLWLLDSFSPREYISVIGSAYLALREKETRKGGAHGYAQITDGDRAGGESPARDAEAAGRGAGRQGE